MNLIKAHNKLIYFNNMFNNNYFQLILIKLTNKINNDLYNNLILIKYAYIDYKNKRLKLIDLTKLINKQNKLLQTNKYFKK
jgi:hypothetical protein